MAPGKPIGQAHIFIFNEFYYFTRNPVRLPAMFNIMRPFEFKAWMAIVCSVVAISITLLVIYGVYREINKGLLQEKQPQIYQFFTQPALYLIEPDKIRWFSSKLSGGKIY